MGRVVQSVTEKKNGMLPFGGKVLVLPPTSDNHRQAILSASVSYLPLSEIRTPALLQTEELLIINEMDTNVRGKNIKLCWNAR